MTVPSPRLQGPMHTLRRGRIASGWLVCTPGAQRGSLLPKTLTKACLLHCTQTPFCGLVCQSLRQYLHVSLSGQAMHDS